MINLIGLIGIYGLISVLLRGLFQNPDSFSFAIIILIAFVAAIAYVNYVTLQFRKRIKEFYIRKLLGANDKQIGGQLILESTVLTTFLVVSGMVLAEIASPWCGRLLGSPFVIEPVTFIGQIVIVLLMVIPIGILSIALPLKNYLKYIRENFAKLSHRTY